MLQIDFLFPKMSQYLFVPLIHGTTLPQFLRILTILTWSPPFKRAATLMMMTSCITWLTLIDSGMTYHDSILMYGLVLTKFSKSLASSQVNMQNFQHYHNRHNIVFWIWTYIRLIFPVFKLPFKGKTLKIANTTLLYKLSAHHKRSSGCDSSSYKYLLVLP